MNVVAPSHVTFAASQARSLLRWADLRGEGFAQVVELSERVALGEPLSRDDQLNLRSVVAREPDSPEIEAVQALLGGAAAREWLFAADLPERPLVRLSQRLAALDERLQERILGQLEAVFKAAVGRTAVKVAKRMPGRFDGCPVGWLDAQPVMMVRAAITDTEEGAVLDTVADVDDLLPPILLAAAVELVSILRAELSIETTPERVMPDPAMVAAVDVARRSLGRLILGRLGRVETEAVTSVPPNIARDVLHAAGGADVTPNGGILKSPDMGRVLVAGVETTGDGFATSQNVVSVISENGDGTQQVEAVRRWRHSGKEDAVPAHRRNDGKRDTEADYSAGPPGGLRNCGCRWVTELEVVA